jgi:hypothetical protein
MTQVDISWSESPKLRGVLEMDLFDASLVREILDRLVRETRPAEKKSILHRLSFMARSRERVPFLPSNIYSPYNYCRGRRKYYSPAFKSD